MLVKQFLKGSGNFMDSIILETARKFNEGVLSVEYITTCRNIIYKAICKDNRFVIRLTDPQVRTKEQIECELQFQNFLFENGADVTKPLITTDNERIIDCVIETKRYYASAFTFAEGLNWYERVDESPEILCQIGKALGKVHKLSKKYKAVTHKRREWYEQQELADAPKLFKDYSKELYTSFMSFVNQMKALEDHQDRYGLTHGDYLMSNYLIDNGKVTIIDFDESKYSWFAMDLAICIRCYLVGDEPEKASRKVELAERIHYNLLLGYQSENTITSDMIYDLNKYIRVRDYIEIAQLLKITKQGKPLCDIENRLLKTDIERVIHNRPFIEFDLNRISKTFEP